MNIEYLENFVEAVTTKSISKTSERLNLTHTALSKQIRRVEDYFGVDLVSRSPFGIELTEAGSVLFERIQPLLAELKAIELELQKYAEKKTISLGTIPSLAAYYLPPRIVSLKEKGIEIDITVRNTSEEIINLLQAKVIDAAVIERLPTHKFFWTHDLFDDPFYAVFPKNHPYSTKNSIALPELANESFVVYPANCTIRKTITNNLTKHHITPKIGVEVDFGEFIPGYVAAGAGIAILPKLAAEHLGHDTLKTIPITDVNAKRIITLLSASENTGRLLLQSFK